MAKKTWIFIFIAIFIFGFFVGYVTRTFDDYDLLGGGADRGQNFWRVLSPI